MTRLLEVLPVAHLHGEGVQWNADDGCLWWTDISGCALHRYHLGRGALESFATPERPGCFAFIEGDARLLVAFATGFALFDPRDGRVRWLDRCEQADSGRRFNDGRVDRQGRFWAGTMVEDATRAVPYSASLYCLDPDGRAVERERGIGISNGLCWSPDGRTMYFADSPRHTIHAYDFDPDSGLPSRRREFARTGPGAEPDGSTVDAEGAVWNAQWGGGRVVRYSPTGEVLETVDTPGAMQPSCVAFGGDALELLCVTSAWIGLDAAARVAQPQAGHVFLYETSARGLPENRARLAPAVLAA
jgi:L-arabinonolactonase